MSLNTAEIVRTRAAVDQRDLARHDAREASGRAMGDDFSTALFTSLNVAVFLVLAACVAGAAILYSLGA